MNNTANMNQDHLYRCVCFGCEKERGRTSYTSSEWRDAEVQYNSAYCEHCGHRPRRHAGHWTKDSEGRSIAGSCQIEDLRENNHHGRLKQADNSYSSFSSEYVFVVSSVFLPKRAKSI